MHFFAHCTFKCTWHINLNLNQIVADQIFILRISHTCWLGFNFPYWSSKQHAINKKKPYWISLRFILLCFPKSTSIFNLKSQCFMFSSAYNKQQKWDTESMQACGSVFCLLHWTQGGNQCWIRRVCKREFFVPSLESGNDCAVLTEAVKSFHH